MLQQSTTFKNAVFLYSDHTMIYFISSIVVTLASSSSQNIICSECRQNYKICAIDVEMRPVTQ